MTIPSTLSPTSISAKLKSFSINVAFSSSVLVKVMFAAVGALFTFATVISKLANDIGVVITLSVTDIIISVYVPTSLLVGVPLNSPVVISNVAQLGLFCML